MKNHLSRVIGLLSVMLISGCLSTKVAVLYDADNGDMILIKRDGEIKWSPLSKATDNFTTLGILPSNAGEEKTYIIMASASPYVGTEIQFSENMDELSIDWERLDSRADGNRASQYKKRN